MQQIHKFFAGDGFFFQKEVRQTVQGIHIILQDADGLLMRGLDGGNHFLINLRSGLRRAGERGIARQILIRHGLERNHIELAAHAVARDHRARQLGGLLDVVGCTGRNRAPRLHGRR